MEGLDRGGSASKQTSDVSLLVIAFKGFGEVVVVVSGIRQLDTSSSRKHAIFA